MNPGSLEPSPNAAPRVRWRRAAAAFLIFCVGTLIAAVLLFGESELRSLAGVVALRDGMAPREVLQQYGGAASRSAHRQLLQPLHAQGLVASLQGGSPQAGRFRYDLPVPTAWGDLSNDGRRLVTSDHIRVFLWSLPDATVQRAIGPRSAREATDIERNGWAFSRVAWLDTADGIVAITYQGRRSLWWLGGEARAPLALPAGVDGLIADQGQIALWSSGGGPLWWLAPGESALRELAHPDLALAAFTADGVLVSASRFSVRRWRNGQMIDERAIKTEYDPVGIADDGSFVLAPGGTGVIEVWQPGQPTPRARLQHTDDVRLACASSGRIAVADSQGRIHVWRADDGERLRTWEAYLDQVTLMRCRGERLLTSGRSGMGGQLGILWDLDGRPQPEQPLWQQVARHEQDWPGPWYQQALLSTGLATHAPTMLTLVEAHGEWLQPAGGALWVLTLALVVWQVRRR